MKNLYLSFIIALLSLSGYSQTFEVTLPARDTVYEAKYNKLKALYVKKIQSDSYKKFSAINKVFMDNLNYKDYSGEIMKGKDAPMDWVKVNLDKTKFTSYEEAEKAWQGVMEASMAATAENKEYQDAMREMMRNGDRDVVKDVMKDVTMERSDRP